MDVHPIAYDTLMEIININTANPSDTEETFSKQKNIFTLCKKAFDIFTIVNITVYRLFQHNYLPP